VCGTIVDRYKLVKKNFKNIFPFFYLPVYSPTPDNNTNSKQLNRNNIMEEEKKTLFAPGQDPNNNLDFSYIKEEIYKPFFTQPDFPSFRFPCPVGLEIKTSTIENAGNGVFTNRDIEEGEIIERVKTLPLADRRRYQHDQVIRDYILTDTCSCKECSVHGPVVRMMMGFGSFYNHQDPPNQNCKWIVSNPFNFLDFVAIKNIKAGEELFTNYGENYFKTRQYKPATVKHA
jgi:hypothetical protein